MPPEPLPWDRKDFFKERKHHNSSHHQNDRTSESLLGDSGAGSLPRWRDYYSSPHHGQELPRWGSADFRRPPGHGKQGGWHLFAEESGHCYPSSWSGERMLEDEITRISVSRGDGKYGRSSRESRSSFSQRDWKAHSWDMSNGSSNTLRRLHDVNCDQRSFDDMLTYPSHRQSDFINTWDHIQLKDQHDNKMGGVNGLGTGQRCGQESSLDWKPLKWTRSGSLSSRGSGLSHSSSSKSMGGVDSSEGKTDLQPKNTTPVQSPSGDAAAYLTSGALSEETTSRKKPRLGWGEGLAKYEKKKVDGPDVGVIKDVAYISTSNAEPVNSLYSNLAEKSPRIAGFSDCTSPATPSSVDCSSSPGVEEKAFGKVANVDNDVSNLCASPCIGSQNHPDGFLFNLEKSDTELITNLGSSLIELLPSDDSSFVRSTAVNKLLTWKGNISKTLETTESEIDSLENELKLLKSALGSTAPCPATSASVSVEENANHFKEQVTVSNSITRPAPLQIDSSGDASFEKMPVCGHFLEENHANAKDEDIDSPGTATSILETLSSVKPDSPPDVLKNVKCSAVVNAIQSTNTEEKRTVSSSFDEEMPGVSACDDGDTLVENKSNAACSSDYSVYADGENILSDRILGSNKESADKASEAFNKLLPRDLHSIDISGVDNLLCRQNDFLIKEKFLKRKQFLRFKERVLTLKFKAFQHLWKEDLRLLAIRKYPAKSQKKSDSSLRTTYNGYQKHRSSVRSRFSSPAAGSVSLVPTTEVINFTSKLLSDSQVKVYRDSLKMPALILDNREKMASRFISNNGLVEDPCAVERERAIINPWTAEEREIFMEKLVTFGKDFRKIASFLDYKTTADCVEFYYKNHKSDCFEKIKQQHDFSKQGKTSTNTYLVTSGKRNRKVNVASLDILGEASEMAAAAQADNYHLISSGRIPWRRQSDSKTLLGDDGIIERSYSFDVAGNEREAAAVDVLAGICGSLSSEAMSSCITSSVDPGDGQWEWKNQKVDSVMRPPSTSDVTQNVDDDTCSDESCGEMDPSDWTDEEKSIFIEAVSSFGKDFSMIARCVRTRSRDQCKVFFSKARKCLGLDLIPGRGNVGTSVNDDANGGGSDAEDACILETSSVISSDKLGSKMDEDLPTHVMNISQDESDHTGAMSLQTDLNFSEDDSRPEVLDDNKDSKDVKPSSKTESMHFELESHSMSGAGKQSESFTTQKNGVVFTVTEGGRDQITELVESSVSARECDGPCPSSSNDVEADVPTKGFGNGLEGTGLILQEESMNDDQDKNCIVETSSESEVVLGSSAPGNALDLAVDTSSCLVPLKLDSVDNPPVVLLPQENTLAAPTFVQQDSSVSQCEKTSNQDRMSSTLDPKGRKDKSVRKSVSSKDHWNASGLPLLDHVESSRILKGYPLAIPTNKEINGDIHGRQFSEVQSILKSDRNVDLPYLAQDCYLQKCNSSISHSSITGLQRLSQNVDQTCDNPKTHVHSLSDIEKQCKNGDVKLFGKILSHPSSSQKSNFSGHENEEKGTHHHRQSSKGLDVKFIAHKPLDGGASVLKLEHNNYVGLEKVPVRSYGFWDGNRIRTGFSSLPDSAILLAKYPAAFSNYRGSSSKMDQTVVKSNELNFHGVAAVLPPREIKSSNRMVDYQVYRSRDGTKLQPFTADTKQRQELLFPEMQRRNGFETLSSLQQQGKGMVGVNVVGMGGILGGGGGSCTGVSDPVAAIRMHYATNDGQSGSITREEESWRGKGDIGR